MKLKRNSYHRNLKDLLWGINFGGDKMSKKKLDAMYREGMKAGAAPFEKKFEKLAQEQDKLGTEVNDKLENIKQAQMEHKEVLDAVIDGVEEMDEEFKEHRLGIKKKISMQNLSEDSRNIISAVFKKHIKDFDVEIKTNEFSQKLFTYIYINDIDYDENDIEYDELIEDLEHDEQVLLYHLVQLYYYFATDEFDDESDILDYIDVNRKTQKKINEEIKENIQLLGKEGYLSAFEYVPEEEYIDEEEFTEETDELDDNESLEEEIPEELEDLAISSIMQIRQGETQTLKYKRITVESYINCEGTLELYGCDIIFNGTDSGSEIKLAEGAKLIATKCNFICEEMQENVFIKADENSVCAFEECEFRDCSRFYKGDKAEFIINKCRLLNCDEKFVEIFCGENIQIEDNDIINDKIIKEQGYDYLFYIYEDEDRYGNAFINNNRINAQNYEFIDGRGRAKELYIFNLTRCDITNCSFKGVTAGCIKMDSGNIKDCTFEECSLVLYLDRMYDADLVHVSGCKFIKCENVLIDAYMSFQGGIIVEFCEFKDCIINQQSVLHEAGIIFARCKESSSRVNEISNCIFDGIKILCDENSIFGNKIFLICTHIIEKFDDRVLRVEDCSFKNCTTERKDNKIIKTTAHYFGLFNKQISVDTVGIQNCTGLNQ